MGISRSSMLGSVIAAGVLAASAARAQDCDGNGTPDEEEVTLALLFEDFDGSGLPPGVTASVTGEWHVTQSCRPPGDCGSGSFMYFGRDSDCTYASGYNGQYTLSGVTLPNASFLELSYCSYFEGEQGGSVFCPLPFDNVYVLVTADSCTPVDHYCEDPADEVLWKKRRASLAQWAGQTVDITWRFSTGDDQLNDFFGWGIDDIRIDTGIPDCNENGVADTCDIATGTSRDRNENGRPDECEERIGEGFCESQPNSTGQAALISAAGIARPSEERVTLSAFRLPPNKFGVFLVSSLEDFVPLYGGGQGTLCLADSSLVRLLPVQSTGMAGEAHHTVDFDVVDFGFLTTLRFQMWYRDVNPMPTSNLTDGVRVSFAFVPGC